MINCTVALQNAVSNDRILVDLSGYLLQNGLITSGDRCEVTNERNAVDRRAADLVRIIQTKVKLDHQNYSKFIDTLKEADSSYYCDILKKLSDTLRKGNCGNFFGVQLMA
jgi:hypothetical protein